jgi:hypothetical protein
MAKWRHPAEFNLTFAQRLRAVADWLDILDARLDHQYGADDVQRDFRRVAAGIEEDGTLDDLLTDLLREFPEQPTYMPEPEPRSLPTHLGDSAPAGRLVVVIESRVDGLPVNHRVLDPVTVRSGDSLVVNYTLNIA